MTTYPQEIDFAAYHQNAAFATGTKQYELLSALEGDDWAAYTMSMSIRGLTIGYDQATDTFTLISTDFGI